MAQIDYGLLANMGGAYAKGQMAAQNYSLNNARMGALQRQQQEEDALRNVLATRSEGELYGLTAHNLARQGGGARDILALEQMGQKQKQLEASSQRQLTQDQQQEAKMVIDFYQKRIELAGKNNDQNGVNSAYQDWQAEIANTNNPILKRAGKAIQSVQLKGDGLEMVMNAPGAILVQQGFKDLDPNANYKITRKNGKYTKIEQAATGKGDFKSLMDLRKEAYSSNQLKQFDQLDTQKNRMDSVFGALQAREAMGEKVSYNAVDQVLVTMLNKILDPSSVVRESEYARTPEGQAIVERVRGMIPKWEKGGTGLTNDERKELVAVVNQMYQGAVPGVKAEAQQYMDIATSYGMDPGKVLPASVNRLFSEPKAASRGSAAAMPAKAPSAGGQRLKYNQATGQLE